MLLDDLQALKESCWLNTEKLPFEEAMRICPLTMEDIMDASARLDRFAAYFRVAFPETLPQNGIVESPLREIPEMKKALEEDQHCVFPGKLLLKMDSHLPVSGSVKARGGVYEVLKTAEEIALAKGMLHLEDDYSILDTAPLRKLFSRYSIAVGSTGNLGLSIGIMSAQLGFRVTVHMSADARQWKKDLLRSKGVTVVEYEGNYSEAVKQGRELAQADPYCHFVDDENSKTLFLGYAVAALRLRKQLQEMEIKVGPDHPLLVYLPCGVGGAPGGIAFGLKQVFGDSVHCFFAEPVQACCMMLGMATGKHNEISLEDMGIDSHTAADGLAVSRASGFVGRLMAPFIAGCYTLTDERMFRMLAQLSDTEKIDLEPSALAGMYGPVLMETSDAFSAFRELENATHLVWATGGSMVPIEEMKKYYQTGKRMLCD
ncbi:MAG: D-serine ammonia-lyase [Clostridiales bacterium]|nr:D-serine ammonia-lyase [Clostridiales bacterium]